MTQPETDPGAPVEKSAFAFINRWLPARWNIFARLAENPVVKKEFRGRMRGRRAFVLLTFYLGLIGLLIGGVYLLLSQEPSSMQWDPEYRQTVGKVIFSAVVLLELLMVTFIGPALTAGAITSEREKQTFDLLRTTLLPARALVLGKLGSSLAYLLLLVFAAMPIEGLAFLLGGVGLGELLISTLLLVVTALFFCTLGLFFSSFAKRTLAATVSTYATILVSSILLGLFLYLLLFFVIDASNLTSAAEIRLTILSWLAISTNPLLSAIVSEAILIADQSFFVTNSFLGSNINLSLPSPWISFTIIYLTLTFLLNSMSIRFVKRPDR